MFERYGLLEGDDFEEMLDLASGFLACADHMPAGNRVGICTSSGGAGVWMADACAAAGLEVPVLDDETRASIDVHLPSYATSQNPVDSTAQGVQKLGYAQFARLAANSPTVDGVIVVITARRSAFLEADLPKLKELARESRKPVFMWTYTLPSPRTVEILNEAGYPLFTSAHGCARTLRAMADYQVLRERLLRPIEIVPVREDAHANVRAMLAESGPVLCEYLARPLLAAYGIGADDAGKLAHSAGEAAAVAHAIGRPVALKVQSADIPHKTEAGAVALDLVGADAVRTAYDRVFAAARRHAPGAHIDGVLVQAMAPPGREVIVGVNRDPTWGLLLMVGLGGVLVEALGDVALAPVPLDHAAARALIGRLTSAAMLGPYRGQPPADIDALADLMMRLSQLASDHDDTIAEIDLNPVIVHPRGEGVSVVDALIVKRGAEAAERRGAAE
jgi:acyl-CoA synthetase (NDP forming)